MNFWVSRLLKNTQLATDFIPETKQSILSRDDNPKTSQSTRACANVCTYLSESYALVGKCLDGKNLEAFWQVNKN